MNGSVIFDYTIIGIVGMAAWFADSGPLAVLTIALLLLRMYLPYENP